MAGIQHNNRPYCTEINSLGLRCSHLAVYDDKCALHNPRRIRCAAFKEDGSRCVRVPMVGSRTCASHTGYTGQLAVDNIPSEVKREEIPFTEEMTSVERLTDITDCREFAKAVLESQEFREYIVYGLRRRDIPATLILRLMDYAEGWGKPPERVEHTGKDGEPIVTEVRRVVIRVNANRAEIEEEETVEALPPATH